MNYYEEFNVYVGNETYELELVGKVGNILYYLYDQINYIDEQEWKQEWLDEVDDIKQEFTKNNWSMDKVIYLHEAIMGGFVAHSELPKKYDYSELK